MKRMTFYLGMALAVLSLASCRNGGKSIITPVSSGRPYEVMVVADDKCWMSPDSALFHVLETGRKVGFKPAGGINSVHDALVYYTIVKELLGEEWLTNELFRLGTSRMANLLLSDIVGSETKFF